nr:hypothetical protein [Nocardioides aurantiacus]
MTKLDRLARALSDARAIGHELTTRHISLSLGGSVYDPTDAVGRLLQALAARKLAPECRLSRAIDGAGRASARVQS